MMNIFFYGGLILFLAGCYVGLGWYAYAAWRWLCLAGMLVPLFFCAFCPAKKKLLAVAVLCFMGILGLWSGMGAGYVRWELSPLFHKDIRAEGYFDALTVNENSFGKSAIFQCRRIWYGGRSFAFGGKIRITSSSEFCEKGFWQVEGKLLPLQIFRNEGTFDMENWNRVQGLGGMVRHAQISKIAEEGPFLSSLWEELRLRLASINKYVGKKLQEILPGDRGLLLQGMLLGGSRGLRDATREIFSANGLSHLLAVSGTHLLLLGALLRILLKPFSRWCWGKKNVELEKKDGEVFNPKVRNNANLNWTNLFILVVLVFYAALCGFKPSVLRALAMSAVVLLSNGKVARGHVLGVTALLLLIMQPLWLLDVGFQLSFASAAGLIWLAPKVQPYMRLLLPKFLAETVTVIVAVQLANLPLVVHYFHCFSWLALPAGVLIVPLLEMGVVVALAGLGILELTGVSIFLQAGGELINQALNWAGMLANIAQGIVVVPAQPWWCWLVYYLFWLYFFNYASYWDPHLGHRRIVCWVCGGLLLGHGVWQEVSRADFEVCFLDVGQGDCAVLLTPERRAVVIDTGGKLGLDTGGRIIVPFLYSRGIREVAALYLSHGDLDHAGGAEGLLRNVPVKKVVLPNDGAGEFIQKAVAVAGNAKLEWAKTGDYAIYDELGVKVVAAPLSVSGNNASVVLEVLWGNYRLLFTGDIDGEREQSLSVTGPYTVVKVPHHGSGYSNTEDFYAKVKPEVAVISVGADNSYGHPHEDALARIAQSGARIFRTDQLGMIRIVFGEAGYEVIGR